MYCSLTQLPSPHQEQCSPVTTPPPRICLPQLQPPPSVEPRPRNSMKISSLNINDQHPPLALLHRLRAQDSIVARRPCPNAHFVHKPLKITRGNGRQA